MSYNTVHACANDQAFIGRLTAACAQEGADQPDAAAYSVRWPVSAKSDIESAYASALAAGNENPGGDESVITDGMILSAIQSLELPNSA
jgi:hypothetical protein